MQGGCKVLQLFMECSCALVNNYTGCKALENQDKMCAIPLTVLMLQIQSYNLQIKKKKKKAWGECINNTTQLRDIHL